VNPFVCTEEALAFDLGRVGVVHFLELFGRYRASLEATPRFNVHALGGTSADLYAISASVGGRLTYRLVCSLYFLSATLSQSQSRIAW
jgi:hypothetical protein